MLNYLARRLAYAFVIVWLSVSLVFFLMYAVGDPAAAALGERASAEQIAVFRASRGLDQPLWRMYLSYLGAMPCAQPDAAARYCGLLQASLGQSLRLSSPIHEVLAERIPRTALLGALATAIELALGVLMGFVAGITRRRSLDLSLLSLAYLGLSVPSFVVGILALDTLAFRLGWFPVGGYGEGALAHLQHAALPALTLGILGAATHARLVRGEIKDLAHQDFVRTLRALGVSRLRIAARYMPRLALVPVVTLAGLQLPLLVGGAVITETLFGWPGLGRLAVEAIYNLDAPLVLAIVLVASIAVQLGNLAADLGLRLLDPRTGR